MPEWSIGAVSKTVVPCEGHRGFESHPLRQLSLNVAECVGFAETDGFFIPSGELWKGTMR